MNIFVKKYEQRKSLSNENQLNDAAKVYETGALSNCRQMPHSYHIPFDSTNRTDCLFGYEPTPTGLEPSVLSSSEQILVNVENGKKENDDHVIGIESRQRKNGDDDASHGNVQKKRIIISHSSKVIQEIPLAQEYSNGTTSNSEIGETSRLKEGRSREWNKASSQKVSVENISQQYKCEFCEYSTTYKSRLIRHTNSHNGIKPHQCGMCLKAFTREGDLNKHMKTHANEFPYHCATCRQGFHMKQETEAHERNCNIRRFECNLCKDTMCSKANLERHMRIHTGELPFKCKMCTKAFTQHWNLRNHMVSHAAEFPLHCSICRQGFRLGIAKEIHEKRCNRRLYECHLCKYFTPIKSQFENHMRTQKHIRETQRILC